MTLRISLLGGEIENEIEFSSSKRKFYSTTYFVEIDFPSKVGRPCKSSQIAQLLSQTLVLTSYDILFAIATWNAV